MTQRSPTVLAMDAAGASCSVALWAEGRVVARRFAKMARGQSERLVPMIGEVMAEWGGGFADLDGSGALLLKKIQQESSCVRCLMHDLASLDARVFARLDAHRTHGFQHALLV